jgi:hypothetical protein
MAKLDQEQSVISSSLPKIIVSIAKYSTGRANSIFIKRIKTNT